MHRRVDGKRIAEHREPCHHHPLQVGHLQVDDDGRGLILGYSPASEEVTIVDRQLLLYRKFATIKWPWEELILEANAQGGQIEAG